MKKSMVANHGNKSTTKLVNLYRLTTFSCAGRHDYQRHEIHKLRILSETIQRHPFKLDIRSL